MWDREWRTMLGHVVEIVEGQYTAHDLQKCFVQLFLVDETDDAPGIWTCISRCTACLASVN
jgi:hypothetical protein